MSGFVALVNLDGAPIDRRLLHQMTATLSFRGPDGGNAHTVGQAGFGCAVLQVGKPVASNRQALSVHRQLVIAGDVRIDARHALVAALTAAGTPVSSGATDLDLIALSYSAWGDGCVERMLGDFSFAVWDGGQRRLFCARDHLGIRPLYFAQIGSTVALSNTLDCVRAHPGVSDDLDERTIADFLLFGENRSAGTTTFRDIQRLPSAHIGTWSADEMRIRRYWTLPVDEPLNLTAGEYQERFAAHLHEAVADRLGTNRATVLMSGGLDSPALAAAAVAVARDRRECQIDAVTSVYERLIPDPDRPYAALAADHLRIPIRYDVRDDEPSLLDWDRISVRTPEPVANPAAFAAGVRFLHGTARGARVFLYGEGPDNALRYEWRPYLAHLSRRFQAGRLMRAIALDAAMHPRVPLWSSVRQLAMRKASPTIDRALPEWLDRAFAARCDCRGRVDEQCRGAIPVHPLRPLGYASLFDVRWQSLFEDCDITGARGQAEFRYPFLDIRLLRYLLALPAMPWCRNKLIIRRAMRTELPQTLLRRSKAPVATSADFVRAQAAGLPRPQLSPELLQFVNSTSIPSRVSTEPELRAALRPLGLGYWLARYRTTAIKELPHATEIAIPV